MQKAIEQLAAFNKRGLDAVLSAWDVAFQGAEKWGRLNIEASKALLAEASEQSKALTAVKTLDELSSLGNGTANATLQRSLGYTRHCQKIAAEAQADLNKWLKGTVDEVKQNVEKTLEGFGVAAPQPAKEATTAALQNATAWTDSLVEASQQVLKQTTEFTEAAFSATAEAIKNGKGKKAFA